MALTPNNYNRSAQSQLWQTIMSSVLTTLEPNDINRVNRVKSHMDGDGPLITDTFETKSTDW